jgi:hypothetical protein
LLSEIEADRAKAALSEIEYRLTQNKRGQQIVATVAKRHRDAGVDKLYEMITRGNRKSDRANVSAPNRSRKRSKAKTPVTR